MNVDDQLENLKSRVAALEKRKEAMQALRGDPDNVSSVLGLKSTEDFDEEEIVAIFEKLHKRATNYVARTITEQYNDSDFKNYFYEEALELMLGEQVWKVLRECGPS